MRLTNYTKRLSIKCLIIVTVVLLGYFVVPYVLLKDMVVRKPEEQVTEVPLGVLKLNNIIVHLDMKGSPPKLSYLKTLLPKLQELGVTGLLMEYEDMFPYEGRLVNLSARNCYEKPKLREFLKLAIQIGFDIIPLVQTFGHMEHVLKLTDFQHLREVKFSPDSICPSKAESQNLIQGMLEQVINFHKDIFPLKYIHIGCDEVFNINKCKQCLKRNLPSTDVYLNHVKVVSEIVKRASPNTTVLIWDDMLRGIPMNIWERIDHIIEPVYWDYGPSIKISHVNMLKYRRKFKNIWIASSFKGADGRAATYPNLRRRFSNNFSWMNLMLNYKFGGENDVFNFEGIILTGWSRYSHMEPPCELLPLAIPSLFLNLLLIKHFKEGTEVVDNHEITYYYNKYLSAEIAAHLHCSDSVNIDYFDTHQCYFDGNELYHVLNNWDQVNINIFNNLKDIESDLYSLDFYCKTNNINMNKVKANIDWCYDSINDISYMKAKLTKVLCQYFDESFVEEYVNFKFYRTKKILSELLIDLKNMSKVRSWPRRPYD